MNADNQPPALDLEAVLAAATAAGVLFDAELTPEERELLATWQSREPLSSLPQAALTPAMREQIEDDFATLAVADALADLALKIRTIIERRKEELYRKCLEVYYATEELSHDPAHAELIPHVEAMRRAHERDYGYPIPPKRGH